MIIRLKRLVSAKLSYAGSYLTVLSLFMHHVRRLLQSPYMVAKSFATSMFDVECENFYKIVFFCIYMLFLLNLHFTSSNVTFFLWFAHRSKHPYFCTKLICFIRNVHFTFTLSLVLLSKTRYSIPREKENNINEDEDSLQQKSPTLPLHGYPF